MVGCYFINLFDSSISLVLIRLIFTRSFKMYLIDMVLVLGNVYTIVHSRNFINLCEKGHCTTSINQTLLKYVLILR